MKVISSWSCFKASLYLPFTQRVCPLFPQTHTRTRLQSRRLPQPASSIKPVYPQSSVSHLSSVAVQVNFLLLPAKALGPKCRLPASDSTPLATHARWSLSQLSAGRCSVPVKCSCTYTWCTPLISTLRHTNQRRFRDFYLCQIQAVFSWEHHKARSLDQSKPSVNLFIATAEHKFRILSTQKWSYFHIFINIEYILI